jgi:predicted nucleic acid-binding protein
MGIGFFFDTYALHEIVGQNENYRPYMAKVKIVITQLNLMEFYYGIYIKHGKDLADKYFDRLVDFVVDIDNDTIKKAMAFRAENKTKNLSYTDCIGYIVAKSLGVKFLTGDNQFKDMPNVEFVK